MPTPMALRKRIREPERYDPEPGGSQHLSKRVATKPRPSHADTEPEPAPISPPLERRSSIRRATRESLVDAPPEATSVSPPANKAGKKGKKEEEIFSKEKETGKKTPAKNVKTPTEQEKEKRGTRSQGLRSKQAEKEAEEGSQGPAVNRKAKDGAKRDSKKGKEKGTFKASETREMEDVERLSPTAITDNPPATAVSRSSDAVQSTGMSIAEQAAVTAAVEAYASSASKKEAEKAVQQLQSEKVDLERRNGLLQKALDDYRNVLPFDPVLLQQIKAIDPSILRLVGDRQDDIRVFLGLTRRTSDHLPLNRAAQDPPGVAVPDNDAIAKQRSEIARLSGLNKVGAPMDPPQNRISNLPSLLQDESDEVPSPTPEALSPVPETFQKPRQAYPPTTAAAAAASLPPAPSTPGSAPLQQARTPIGQASFPPVAIASPAAAAAILANTSQAAPVASMAAPAPIAPMAPMMGTLPPPPPAGFLGSVQQYLTQTPPPLGQHPQAPQPTDGLPPRGQAYSLHPPADEHGFAHSPSSRHSSKETSSGLEGAHASASTAGGNKAKPHACPTCGRSFARLEHLKRHERSHTKEKPFECPDCKRCFARRDLVQRHQLKLHMTPLPVKGAFGPSRPPHANQHTKNRTVPAPPVGAGGSAI